MTAFAVALVVAGGLAGAVQAAVMGRLGERVGSLEAFAFAAVLTAGIGVVLLLVGRRSLHGFAAAAREPVWLWSGAAMGALIVLGITIAAPRIGTTATIGIIVAGNLVMAAVIDRYGWFGLDKIPFHAPRLVGLVLLIAGAGLSLKR